jgi:hypothetical protein
MFLYYNLKTKLMERINGSEGLNKPKPNKPEKS